MCLFLIERSKHMSRYAIKVTNGLKKIFKSIHNCAIPVDTTQLRMDAIESYMRTEVM